MKHGKFLGRAIKVLGLLALASVCAIVAGVAYLLWLDSSSAARRTRQFCVAVESALDDCPALKEGCVPNYHKIVTNASAKVKNTPADISALASWLEDFDVLYLEGKMLAQQIQAGALEGNALTNAIAKIHDVCLLMVGDAEL